jgi:hypothetical protein
MPLKRRAAKRRLDVLDINRRGHLETGAYLWGHFRDQDEFADDAERREAWARHREMILTEWCHPGRRPDALWSYDAGDWRQFGETEEDAVYQLLKAGRLTECRFNGALTIESEIAQIEADWLRETELAIFWGTAGDTIDEPLQTRGTPTWFYALHAPRLRAEAKADRAKFAAQFGRA